MSGFGFIGLQQAVYTVLDSDSALGMLIEGVYDHAPESTEFPYLVVDNFQGESWSTLMRQGVEILFDISLYSRAKGKKEASTLMEHIYALLHHAALDVTGFQLASLEFTSADVALQDDGATYKGIMRFRALLYPQ